MKNYFNTCVACFSFLTYVLSAVTLLHQTKDCFHHYWLHCILLESILQIRLLNENASFTIALSRHKQDIIISENEEIFTLPLRSNE